MPSPFRWCCRCWLMMILILALLSFQRHAADISAAFSLPLPQCQLRLPPRIFHHIDCCCLLMLLSDAATAICCCPASLLRFAVYDAADSFDAFSSAIIASCWWLFRHNLAQMLPSRSIIFCCFFAATFFARIFSLRCCHRITLSASWYFIIAIADPPLLPMSCRFSPLLAPRHDAIRCFAIIAADTSVCCQLTFQDADAAAAGCWYYAVWLSVDTIE